MLLIYSFRNCKSKRFLWDKDPDVAKIYVPFSSLRDQSFFLPYQASRSCSSSSWIPFIFKDISVAFSNTLFIDSLFIAFYLRLLWSLLYDTGLTHVSKWFICKNFYITTWKVNGGQYWENCCFVCHNHLVSLFLWLNHYYLLQNGMFAFNNTPVRFPKCFQKH